jgi:hypothetical protein
LLLEAHRRRPHERLLVGLALAQDLRHRISQIRRYPNAFYHVAEQSAEILFPNVAVATGPLRTGAVVVNVQTLLQLCRERAAAPGALYETNERVLAFGAVRGWFAATNTR